MTASSTNSKSATDRLVFTRNKTREIYIGNLAVGGENPIRIQARVKTSALDLERCVEDILEYARRGCEIVNVSVPSMEHAQNLRLVKESVRAAGCDVPLAADVVEAPEVAMEAVRWVERIWIDPAKFAEDLEDAREQLEELVLLCKEFHCSLLIGAIQGNVASRALAQYGDTPIGMCQSVIEFAGIVRELDFHNLSFFMKSSDPRMMIEVYRLLVVLLIQQGEGWNYPIHLWAHDKGAESLQKIRSTIGVGSLLADGIGDTYRLALNEDIQSQVQYTHAIITILQSSYLFKTQAPPAGTVLNYEMYPYSRRPSKTICVRDCKLGSEHPVRLAVMQEKWNRESENITENYPDLLLDESEIVAVNPYDSEAMAALNDIEESQLVTVMDGAYDAAIIHAFRMLAGSLAPQHQILLKYTLRPDTQLEVPDLYNEIRASINLGSLLVDGIGDVILIFGELNLAKSLAHGRNILEVTRPIGG